MNLEILVTGTGRCGTVYMARMLTKLGITCGHESIFDWRGWNGAEKILAGLDPPSLSHVSTAKFDGDKWEPVGHWIDLSELRGDSSYMAAPFLDKIDAKIIHVIRHPVKVVNSFCNYIDYFKDSKPRNSYENFIYRQIPELAEEMPQYDRACVFYMKWNDLITKHEPDLLYRIEDDPKIVTDFLGVSGDILDDKTINSLKKPCKRKFSIDDIESDEIRYRFVNFGKYHRYNMSSEFLMV